MTYQTHRYGFDSLRILAAATYAPGASTVAVTGSFATRCGTLHHLVVERPDTGQTMTVSIYDCENISQVGAGTLVLLLRPWGIATDGSRTIPIHRNFMRGIVVVTNNANGDVTVVYGPAGGKMPTDPDNFIARR